MFLQESGVAFNFILVTSLVIATMALVIANFVSYFQNKKLINEKRITTLKINYENNLLKAQIQAQEQTFQNISREIHDNIGQKLTLAKLQLNLLSNQLEASLKEHLQDSIKIISTSLNDLRDVSRSLSSEVIINSGLIKAVENEINQLNKTSHYLIKLKITGDTFYMDANRELAIFRIIQESLSNIIKHAEATAIDIDFYYADSMLTIAIKDNGIGFDLAALKTSNGINNIRNRASSLNGEAYLVSKPHHGTIVNIKIPQYETAKI